MIAGPAARHHPMPSSDPIRRLVLPFPLDRPHRGLPMANGELGVLVFGSGRTLELCISLASCFDRRYGRRLERPCPYPELVALYDRHDVAPVNRRLAESATRFPFDGGPAQLHWTSSRIGGGRFRLHLRAELAVAELDYASGAVLVGTADGGLRLDLSLAEDVLLIADPAGLVAAVEAVPMWDALAHHFAPRGFQPPQRLSGEQQAGWFQPLPADPGMYALLRRCADGWCLAAGLSREGMPGSPAAPEREAVRRANAAWWSAWWRQAPAIDLPDADLAAFYRLALYKFAAATHPHGKACSLQGPWLEDYQVPPWSCDYHFNVNVQQVYDLALPIGAEGHLLPLFDMLESEPYQRTLRANARMLLGIDDGLLMFHALDDIGHQCGGIHAGGVLDFACGGWTALLYWQHFLHTGDQGFLRARGWPFMRGIMRVFEAALEEREGRLSLPLAISAEYGCIFPVAIDGRLCNQNTGRDPSSQLACIHALANALIAAARELGEEPAPRWLEIKRRLPLFTPVAGADGRRHVAIWEGQDLDVCHRHHSHLSLIHPFDLVHELDEDGRQVVDDSLDHWIARGMGEWSEWCYPWAMMIQARWDLGEAPAALLGLWKRLFLNESLATVYLPRFRGLTAHRRADMRKPRRTNEVMQLDGTMAGASALLELMVHQRGGTVHLFAGIPAEWPDASFDGVRLQGGCRISAVRRNGRVERIELRPARPGRLRIALGDGRPPAEVALEPGRTLLLDGEGRPR